VVPQFEDAKVGISGTDAGGKNQEKAWHVAIKTKRKMGFCMMLRSKMVINGG